MTQDDATSRAASNEFPAMVGTEDTDDDREVYSQDETAGTVEIHPDQWIEDEEVWSPTGTLYIPRVTAPVPVVRPTRFRSLPQGMNYVLLILLVVVILLAIYGFIQLDHAIHVLTTPTPTAVPTHTPIPSPTLTHKKK